jgi:hypothetical protein
MSATQLNLDEALTKKSLGEFLSRLRKDDIRYYLYRDEQPIWNLLGYSRPIEMTDYLRHECLDPLRRKLRAFAVRHSRAANTIAAQEEFLEVFP